MERAAVDRQACPSGCRGGARRRRATVTKASYMKTTRKQREKRAGGVTGKGFLPGVSGNPNGRPRTAKFSEATRQLLAEIDAKSGETNAEYLARHWFKR